MASTKAKSAVTTTKEEKPTVPAKEEKPTVAKKEVAEQSSSGVERQEMTIEDVIKSYEKHGAGNLLVCEMKEKVTKTPKAKKGPASSVKYYPLKIRNLNGQLINANIKFMGQIAMSSARYYKDSSSEGGNEERNKPNKVSVAFTKLDDEILQKTDYKSNKYDELKNLNANFLKFCSIINQEYQLCADKLRKELDEDKTINKFEVTKRKPTEDELAKDPNLKLINLKHPLYRIKIHANVSAGYRFGYSNEKQGWMPIIYDMNSLDSNKNPSEAMLIQNVDGKKQKVPLTVDNIGDFVTRLSLLAGVVRLSCIIKSNMGYSLDIRFSELYVRHHRQLQYARSGVTTLLETLDMDFGGSNEEAVSVSKTDETDSKSKAKIGKPDDDDEEEEAVDDTNEESPETVKAEENEGDEEEAEQDGEEAEEPVRPSTPPREAVKPTKQAAAKPEPVKAQPAGKNGSKTKK
jgi:hypothetical protein